MVSQKTHFIHWYFVVFAIVIIFSVLLFSRDFLARLAWQNFHNADVALLLGRKDAALAAEIGKYHFNGGAYDLEKAKRAYARARAIDPKLLGTRFQLSRIEFIGSRFDSALALANEELAAHPEFDRVYYLRGLIHGYSGDLPAAAEDFTQFLKYHEKSWAAHNDLAWIYFRQGEFEKVAETAKAGLESNPGNPWLLTTYGAALLNLDKKTEAKKMLGEALSVAEKLTPEEWGKAYPGNNPSSYESGLHAMRGVIRANLGLAGKPR